MALKVRVCSVAELEPGQVKLAPTRTPIAVYNLDGEFYAIADFCTHEDSSLSQEGYIDGEEIECGWHCARFSIKTGAVTAPPATKPLKTYEVRVENGDLYLVLQEECLAVSG